MAVVWIGDFRCRSLQCAYELSAKTDAEHIYIIDDLGASAWFCSDAQYQLEKLSLTSSSIIVMTGLLDCVNSCIWPAMNITKIVEDYKATLEYLKNNYVGHTFYFCAVCPVESNYAHAFAENGMISAEILNKKIESFNDQMKESCPVTFLDSHEYVNTTSLKTRDGVHYMLETADAIQNFVLSKVNLYSLTATSTFMSKTRLTAADAPNKQDESAVYWKTTSAGGYNKCIEISDGWTLPNCVGYAWGRFHEILGETPKLSTGNAGDWYDYNDGYERGTEPRAGAVICWGHVSAAGHVGIVERINEDGSITTSESNYRDEVYDPTNSVHFGIHTRYNTNGNWGLNADTYIFKGFIYCPKTTVVTTTNTELCTKNSYSITLDEMAPNAQYIWQYFGSRGWTKNAVAGMLGNMQQEAYISPCCWEGLIKGSIINADGTHTLNTSVLSSFSGGYGLTQWTPYTKYIEWCNSGSLNGTGSVLPYWEIDTQLLKIEDEVVASKDGKGWQEPRDQWISVSEYNNMTFEEFITSTKSAYELAGVFACSYERPNDIINGTATQKANMIATRGEYASYWYNFLGEYSTAILTSSKQFRLAAFILDSTTSTDAKVSFIINNGISYSCTLKHGSDVISTVSNEFTEGTETITFENLKPNTKYKVSLEATGENDTSFSDELSFRTLQSYPESVKSVELTPKFTNNFKDVNNTFKLKVTKPDDLGYWKNNPNGYWLRLSVNGDVVSSKKINTVKDLYFEDFDLKKEFGYTCKPGDNIQVGVRTWVTTDADGENKIYDAKVAKMSRAICLLDKPVEIFLNLDT